MRPSFDPNLVAAEYREALTKRLRFIGPVIGGIVLLILSWMGTFTVEPGERGVVQTFGGFSGLKEPGLHFIVPLFQRYTIVNVEKVRREEIGFTTTPAGPKIVPAEAQMLTGDENIVEVQMIVQYRVSEPDKFIFRLADPEQTLHVAAEVALRDVVGQMRVASDVEGEEQATDKPKVDPQLDILTQGREGAQDRVKELLQRLMTHYESGVEITVVKLLPVDVPDDVKDAFHDVVRAREEREQKINEARAYREDKIPRAKGEEQKILNTAEGYKRRRIAQAQGEAGRFQAVLKEYLLARTVTRQRLHLETMERILGKVQRKVLIDQNVARGTLPLLPLGEALAAPPGGAAP